MISYKGQRSFWSNDHLITEYTKGTLEMPIFMDYFLMLMKGWSLDDKYMVYIMILHLGLAMVWAFTYQKIEYRKNKSLIWCIDRLAIKTVNDVPEISKDKNVLLKFYLWSSYDCLMINIS